ncbi:hypothetical protein [Pseudomonas syringae]|uniref:hypothetical protein n=1 Tax=Pseudomonas syringae TaxID=317 RepID=UPI001141E0D1|nr:hypothetical protein [Pseudomonas syringae]
MGTAYFLGCLSALVVCGLSFVVGGVCLVTSFMPAGLFVGAGGSLDARWVRWLLVWLGSLSLLVSVVCWAGSVGFVWLPSLGVVGVVCVWLGWLPAVHCCLFYLLMYVRALFFFSLLAVCLD